MWPLISPASGAPDSAIFVLMSECPVRHISGVPPIRFTSSKSTWLAAGAYADFVAERVFTGLDVDGFFLEYDDERSGGFEPLRFVPKGKRVVLGLVSSKLPQLESKDLLKKRIDQAAKFVPLENLCISPQCGFSSTHHGNNLTVEQEKAKLKLCIDVANEVWGGK